MSQSSRVTKTMGKVVSMTDGGTSNTVSPRVFMASSPMKIRYEAEQLQASDIANEVIISDPRSDITLTLDSATDLAKEIGMSTPLSTIKFRILNISKKFTVTLIPPEDKSVTFHGDTVIGPGIGRSFYLQTSARTMTKKGLDTTRMDMYTLH